MSAAKDLGGGKTCVIANPRSGRFTDAAALAAALAALPGAELRVTEGPGDAEALARRAVEEGCELVVAAGGDGTVHEVLNGLMAAPRGAGALRGRLGILPLGTGNDFARSIDVPADLAAAVAVLARGRVMAVDVGRITAGASRWFLNVSAGGFSGLVSERLNPELKRSWGPLSYLRSAVEALPELASYETTITIDGGETLALAAYSVVVANARYVAAGIPVAPQAELDDGLLDLMVIPEASMPQLAALLPLVLLGRHEGSDLVVFRRAGHLEIRSEPLMWFNADGEPLGEGPATYEVLPRALEVVVGGN